MTYRFGQFELDVSTRELRRDGELIDTEPRAFDLLVHLVENSDRAVSKDELLAELWPRQIVTETALTRAVMKARRAVGDDSGRQGVIRTVHGHGYRFVAPLEAAEPDTPAAPDAAEPEAEGEAPAARRRSRSPVFVGVAALVAILAVAAVGLLLSRDDPPALQAGVIAVLPVHDATGDAELSWVRLGLMSLLQRMLADNGVEVAADDDVLRAIGEESVAVPPGPELFDSIRRAADADAVFYTSLTSKGGLHQLSAVLLNPDGSKTRRVIVGQSPAALAADMAGIFASLLKSEVLPRADRFARYSTDPFVNELYARALDLELQGNLESARQLFRLAAEQEPELFWLRYEIALCTRDLREWDEAERLFDALYDEAVAGTDARALFVTLNSYGVMLLQQNRYEDAEARFNRALSAAIGPELAAERATAYVNLGLITSRRGAFDEAALHYDAALTAFEAAGQEPAPTFLNNYAGLLLRLGRLDQARAFSERAVAGFQVMGHRRFEAPSLNRLARILRRQGDLDGAMERHQQALSIYRDIGNEIGELSVMNALSTVYRLRGDLSRADNNSREVLDRARRLDDEILLGDSLMGMAAIDMDLKRYADALIRFEEGLRIFDALGDASGSIAASEGIVRAALRLDDLTRARRVADQRLAAAIEAAQPQEVARAQLLRAEVARADDEAALARELCENALAYARDSGDVSLQLDAAKQGAELYLDDENPAAAAELLDDVRDLAVTDRDFQRIDARAALALDDRARAARTLEALRQSAGEAWTAEDEALLADARL